MCDLDAEAGVSRLLLPNRAFGDGLEDVQDEVLDEESTPPK